jgi:hypothetical protein
VGLSLGLAVADDSPSVSQRLGDLAVAADRAYDASAGWRDARRDLPPHLEEIAALVVAQMSEEGIAAAAMPTNGVSWSDEATDRSDVLGGYSAWSDAVRLNERYIRDPGRLDRPWLAVLVHEIVHAQGLRDEARTEAVAMEVTAALCNQGWDAACVDLWDLLRHDAALAIWWSEAYGEPLSTGFAGATGLRHCPLSGCPKPGDRQPTFDALRRQIFTPAEWAALAKRLREWAAPSQEYDYRQVIGTYVARVLPTLLELACGSGALTVDLAATYRYGVGPVRPARTVTLPVDDFAFQAGELGWPCQVDRPGE